MLMHIGRHAQYVKGRIPDAEKGVWDHGPYGLTLANLSVGLDRFAESQRLLVRRRYWNDKDRHGNVENIVGVLQSKQ
jgi:hypothetical protein